MGKSFATLKALITTGFLSVIQVTACLQPAKALQDDMQRLQKLNCTESLDTQAQRLFPMLLEII